MKYLAGTRNFKLKSIQGLYYRIIYKDLLTQIGKVDSYFFLERILSLVHVKSKRSLIEAEYISAALASQDESSQILGWNVNQQPICLRILNVASDKLKRKRYLQEVNTLMLGINI